MRTILAAIFGLIVSGAAAAQDAACEFDPAYFASQDYETFNASAEGWQSLALIDCYGAAADAIASWYEAYAASLEASQLRTLTWNAGLMRAADGDYASAIFLFQQTFPPLGEDAPQHYYTYGVIAFLERDRDGLARIRDAMASMPAPPGGASEHAEWPPHLSSVDGLLRCFDSPFAFAIVGACGDNQTVDEGS